MTTVGDAKETGLEKQNTFESIEQVIERFRQEDGYIVDHRLATMVFLTTRLEKPILIEGPAAHGVAGLVNLFGIESPGLTSSLAIGRHVAALLP